MWEHLTSAVTPFLIEALAPMPGERVLDLGCGVGTATMRIAAAVGPAGTVTGIDICPAVIEEAKRRATSHRNLMLHVGDAARDCFPSAPFTAATSQFGVMFFDDPIAGFTNIRRHLTTDARLCFSCWQSADLNPWSYAAKIADLLPLPPESSNGYRPGPFSLSDPGHLRRILTQSGYHSLDIRAHRTCVVLPEETVVDDTELTGMGVPVAKLFEARHRVWQVLKPHRHVAGLLQIPLAFHLVTATAGIG